MEQSNTLVWLDERRNAGRYVGMRLIRCTNSDHIETKTISLHGEYIVHLYVATAAE